MVSLTRKAVVSLILLFGVPLLAQAPHPPIPTLQDAISSGKMTMEFEGDGGSSGDSIKARPAKGPKAGPGPVEAEILPGSVLRSRDPGAQSMMVSEVRGKDMGRGMMEPASRIVAGDEQPATYILSAFCINFEKENPSSSTTFTLERPDPVLACIAKRGRGLSIPALQAAVWMYTDNVTNEGMSHKFPVTTQDWTAGQSVFRQCGGASADGLKAMPIQIEHMGTGRGDVVSSSGNAPFRGHETSVTDPPAPQDNSVSHTVAPSLAGIPEPPIPEDASPSERDDIRKETDCVEDVSRSPQVKKLCYHIRGMAWLAVGRYNEAISDLSESLRLPPGPLPGPTGDALLYSLRAAAYLSIGNREKFLADMSECIRLDPSAVNYSNRGFEYTFFGMFDEAVQDLTTAILLEPKNTVYRGYRAAAFGGWGKFDRALADVDAALAGDKGSFSAVLNAQKKQICGDARRAGQTFDTCLGF